MNNFKKFDIKNFTYQHIKAEEKLEILNEKFIKCEKINLFNFFLFICDTLNAHELYCPFLLEFAKVY